MTPWTQGGGTAPASNLGGVEDGKVAAPTQSSTQKTASHLIRLGRTACGVDHAVRGARPTVTRFTPPPGLKATGGAPRNRAGHGDGYKGRGARGDQDGRRAR
eukprot:scaffold51302_cov34-Phaeocystis_antarctica.AAC.1